MNLFVLQGLRPQYPFGTIVRGAFPFFLVVVGAVLLLIPFPGLVTALPRAMIGR
jgi:TRAP-type C4-dicarboxylate transport system permease large subunit